METKKDIQLIQYKEIYRNNKNSNIIYKLGLVNDYNILLRISINGIIYENLIEDLNKTIAIKIYNNLVQYIIFSKITISNYGKNIIFEITDDRIFFIPIILKLYLSDIENQKYNIINLRIFEDIINFNKKFNTNIDINNNILNLAYKNIDNNDLVLLFNLNLNINIL